MELLMKLPRNLAILSTHYLKINVHDEKNCNIEKILLFYNYLLKLKYKQDLILHIKNILYPNSWVPILNQLPINLLYFFKTYLNTKTDLSIFKTTEAFNIEKFETFDNYILCVIKYGNIKNLESLLLHLNSNDQCLIYPILEIACFNGCSIEKVKYILDFLKVDSKFILSFKTCFENACIHGQYSIVNLLLNYLNKNRMVGFQSFQNFETFQRLITLTMRYKHCNIIYLLLKYLIKNIDVNYFGKMNGNKIFLCAIHNSLLFVMKLLLYDFNQYFKIDLSYRNNQFFITSVIYGSIKIVEFLLDYLTENPKCGINPSSQENEPLKQAIFHEHNDIFNLLLRYLKQNPKCGIDLLCDNQYALIQSIKNGNYEIVKSLINFSKNNQNCKINYQINNNEPLRLAAFSNNFKIFKMLMIHLRNTNHILKSNDTLIQTILKSSIISSNVKNYIEQYYQYDDLGIHKTKKWLNINWTNCYDDIHSIHINM